ncbi:carbohydrate porin [Piscinibacter aquaticus]|uniref:Carbohydrate porin n=1 Tax=Piscinibacter aquaticus TaxID=392597 RepID=A0A5C6U2J8_9BURK|nr:carbohydrate porin [Piscinibacter aquaticus]
MGSYRRQEELDERRRASAIQLQRQLQRRFRSWLRPDQKGGEGTAKLAKLTVAPQVALSGGFWARPVFRAFATYAKWNDQAQSTVPQGGGAQVIDRNQIANGVFKDKTNGMSYGVQVEAWW